MKTFRQYLNETPLSHYSVVPAKDKTNWTTHGFNKIDLKIIQNPNTEKKLKEIFNRIGYDFNIIFYESDYVGLTSKVEIRKGVENYIKQNNIKTEGKITFAKNGSSGNAITPWILIHTIGHALNDQAHGMEPISNKLNFLHVSGLRKAFMFSSIKEKPKMKYATSSAIAIPEMEHELIAEYIWHGGKIRINPNFENMVDSNDVENNKIQFDDDGTESIYWNSKSPKVYTNALKSAVKNIEQQINSMLNIHVGDIIYDFYGQKWNEK